MRNFTYQALPGRVVFGSGTLSNLGAELDRLHLSRALILTTREQETNGQESAGRLGERCVGVFAGAVMHTPVEVTATALDVIRELQPDCVIAIGGGSTTGLSKAIALRTDLPQVVVPTTYAGSEMTPILGETENGVKTTLRSAKVLPVVVIYDVDLTLTLSPAFSATSGFNAIAHAVEALYAEDHNPIISLMAEESVRALARALPRIVDSPADHEARGDALYGAWLAGTCLGAVGMALHHKLCHALGGSFGLPHAETHTVVLPHATAYNGPFAVEAMDRVARALGAKDPARALFELSGRLGAKRSLRELGMPESGIERAANLAVEKPYWNPRPIELAAIRDLIARAWAGDPPLYN